ncbi:MAG TPA: SCO6880 family protein [Solirubrobacteraceae bacterium]|nr:SCO6880 family protein [Solirubrobacteraceae bacterium]
MSDARLSYRFGPVEQRGLLGPFSLGQVATVGGALLCAVILLDTLASAAGAVLGVILVLGAGAAATVPVGGRPPVGWLPILSGYAWRGARGRRRFLSGVPTFGRAACAGADAELGLPGELRGLRLRTLAHRTGTVGAVVDDRGRRLVAALACQVDAFGLLDAAAQERRLSGWGAVLAASANTAVRRLQWIERTAPADGDELARWLHEERDPQLGERGSALMESYLELIEASAPVMHGHELLLVVQIDRRQVRGPAEAADQALIDELERIARALEGAEVKVLGALGAAQLAAALRTGVDPFARGDLATLRAAGTAAGTGPTALAPVARQEAWDHLRADGALHATFWIAGWPRVEVAPAFMSALLAPSATVRTIAVTFEPLAPERSVREVEAAITRDRAERELRHRFGQIETARQRQSQESALRREAELAAGHAEVRFSGFITVSGRDAQELHRACQETLQQAALARLELRRLYGRQAEALTFTLPLARGLA